MKKYLEEIVVFTILLTVIISVITSLVLLKNKSTAPQQFKTSDVMFSLVSDQSQCVNLANEVIIGSWKPINATPIVSPTLILEENKSFTILDWNDSDFIYEGNWEFNDSNNKLTLRLSKYDSKLENLVSNINKEYVTPNSIIFVTYINYLLDNPEVTKCDKNRFNMDLLGIYVYKNDEI